MIFDFLNDLEKMYIKIGYSVIYLNLDKNQLIGNLHKNRFSDDFR